MEEEDLSTQSIIKAFSICPIPTRSSARDDGIGEQHTVISEGANDKNAAPIHVISTVAERSGEISPSDDTGGITVGDLSTQSIMGALSICLP